MFSIYLPLRTTRIRFFTNVTRRAFRRIGVGTFCICWTNFARVLSSYVLIITRNTGKARRLFFVILVKTNCTFITRCRHHTTGSILSLRTTETFTTDHITERTTTAFNTFCTPNFRHPTQWTIYARFISSFVAVISKW